MKKIILYILAIACVSCSDDFLSLSPTNRANVNQFYNNKSDFGVALIGAYGSLMGGQFADLRIYLSDMRSDDATAAGTRGSYQAISFFQLGASAGEIRTFYSNGYQAIQAANAIIDRVEGKGLTAEDQNRIVGEAKFIRAMVYFYLVNVFGDVPLILEETSGSNLENTRTLARTPAAQVYTQIIADLTDASAKIPPFTTPNRASGLGAKALLGKVYMFQKDYPAAAAQLNAVVASGRFRLVPNFRDLYKIGNASNSESIFVIEHIGSANGTGSAIGFQFAPGRVPLGAFAVPNQGIYVQKELYEKYTRNDTIRRDMTAQKKFAKGDDIGGDTVYYSKKYLDVAPFASNNASNNNYVLRYADVLLLLAEAQNEIGYSASGDALANLNRTRIRAGIRPLTAAEVPDQRAFRDAVLLERRLELALEGHRWFDLVRTGRAIETINKATQAVTVKIDQNALLYPIPQGEILNNPGVITQNPGY